MEKACKQDIPTYRLTYLVVCRIHDKIFAIKKKIMNTKIDSIEIAGFKSIAKDRPLHLTLGDVNILLGPNIISFFRMLNFMMSGTLQNFVATNGTNQAFLHFGAKVTPSIDATIRLRGSKDRY